MAKEVKFTTIGSDVNLTSVTVNPDAAPTATPRQGGFTLRNRWNCANVSASSLSMWAIDDATLNDDAVTNFRVLKVPERTYVKDLFLTAVKSQAVPAFKLTGAQASNTDVTASDLDTTYLEFGADWNKKPENSSSYAAASHLVHVTALNSRAQDGTDAVIGRVFGALALNCAAEDGSSDHHQYSSSEVNLTFVDYFTKIDSSIASPTKPMQNAKKVYLPTSFVADSAAATELTNQTTTGMYFPYGGYVTMRLGPYNTSQGASTVADATGYYSGTTAATVVMKGVWEIQANCNYVPE